MRGTEDAALNSSCWHSICHKLRIHCTGIETGSPQPDSLKSYTFVTHDVLAGVTIKISVV